MTKEAVRPGGRRGQAVVIGGGYAGLLAARVLADHFARVVVLERDPVDARTGSHPHAPQGYHAHAMLARGGEVLEALFPGLRAELREIGAPVFDYGEYISFLLPAGFAPRSRTGVEIQTFTRDELERRLRGRVLALPGVTVVSPARCESLGLAGPGRVNRVRYRLEGAGQPTEIEADWWSAPRGGPARWTAGSPGWACRRRGSAWSRRRSRTPRWTSTGRSGATRTSTSPTR